MLSYSDVTDLTKITIIQNILHDIEPGPVIDEERYWQVKEALRDWRRALQRRVRESMLSRG